MQLKYKNGGCLATVNYSGIFGLSFSTVVPYSAGYNEHAAYFNFERV